MTQLIQVVTPAHNEAGSIAQVLRSFHRQVTAHGISLEFIVCEDGSKDNTLKVIRELQHDLPIKLITSPHRKGYSQAVLDGLKSTSSNYVGFVDSDGQYDPRDFVQLFKQHSKHPLVIGYRHPRQDPYHRLIMSNLFRLVYQPLFHIPLKDPSCPYFIIKRTALNQIIHHLNIPLLDQGFWWEFYARAKHQGIPIKQIPVRHQPRLTGQTAVYQPQKIPRLACQHLLGLFKLKSELNSHK